MSSLTICTRAGWGKGPSQLDECVNRPIGLHVDRWSCHSNSQPKIVCPWQLLYRSIYDRRYRPNDGRSMRESHKNLGRGAGRHRNCRREGSDATLRLEIRTQA